MSCQNAILIPLTFLFIISTASAGKDTKLPEEYRKAIETIRQGTIQAFVEVLASDEMNGRFGGSIYEKKAANYIVSVFKKTGLIPSGHKANPAAGRGDWETAGQSYFQEFQITGNITKFLPEGNDNFTDISRNCIGLLEGTDPNLKNEYIIIGAHYDHIGNYNDNRYYLDSIKSSPEDDDPIFNGANDNASGTSCMLMLAKAIWESGIRFKRSILFIAFGAEELGLKGSKYYVTDPVVPLNDTILMVNMDMIGGNKGRNFRIKGFGSEDGTYLKDTSERIAGELAIKPSYFDEPGERSDQAPFFYSNVPVIQMGSGMTRSYNKVWDEPDLLDYERMEKTVEFLLLLLKEVANNSERPKFNTEFKNRRTEQKQGAKKHPLEKSDPDLARDTITPESYLKHVSFLASDELGGRDTPSEGLNQAAEYIVNEFKQYGLEAPKSAPNYIQWWPYSHPKKKNIDNEGIEVPNCIGYIEGSDPELKEEYIIIGAHMDHIGIIRDAIHNGADDNASGTAGVLKLAEALSSLKEKPKRSIVFMTFSGEEDGLLGSKYYTKNPIFPLENTVAMLNFDMIGRSWRHSDTDKYYLFLGGTGTTKTWSSLLDKYIQDYDIHLERGEGGLAPSDNSAFCMAGIPVLFFYTNSHMDYHAPGDDTEKINSVAATTILKFAFDIIYEIACTDVELPFKKGMAFRSMPEDFEERKLARFGVVYAANTNSKIRKFGLIMERKGKPTDIKGHNTITLSVRAVKPGSAAETIGLQKRDRIIGFNGTSLITDSFENSVLKFVKLFNKVNEGDKLIFKVIRGKETITLNGN